MSGPAESYGPLWAAGGSKLDKWAAAVGCDTRDFQEGDTLYRARVTAFVVANYGLARPLAGETGEPQPWMPMTTPEHLAALGKSIEEMGEAIAKMGRCIIQGVGAAEPVTGKLNADALREEFADVRSTMRHVERVFAWDPLHEREARKFAFLGRWMAGLRR